LHNITLASVLEFSIPKRGSRSIPFTFVGSDGIQGKSKYEEREATDFPEVEVG
jgi:hypothetical protein